MVTKFPSDFAIFLPSTCRKPLCIQKFAITGECRAQRVCAISFSWCGKTRSMPPPWISKVLPRYCHAMAEHSMCQPGRPDVAIAQGEAHAGSSSVRRSEEHTSELQSL